jgi:metal-responsive CopG/Arc/MetJ family transcriptional regulator
MKKIPNKTKPISIRFDQDLMESIDEYMLEKGVYDFSLAVRQLVRRGTVEYSKSKLGLKKWTT